MIAFSRITIIIFKSILFSILVENMKRNSITIDSKTFCVRIHCGFLTQCIYLKVLLGGDICNILWHYTKQIYLFFRIHKLTLQFGLMGPEVLSVCLHSFFRYKIFICLTNIERCLVLPFCDFCKSKAVDKGWIQMLPLGFPWDSVQNYIRDVN